MTDPTKPTLALLHTTPVTVQAMKDLAARELPGVRVINILDDSLLADVIAAGGVTDAVRERLEGYARQAATA
ncbi:MAG TPA: Asp/Glu racemase, partial [Deinococcales bacterium]|nr:Asp/Glu racemase [Deinococcales bacterium]